MDPSHIMQIGMGFFAPKTLLSASVNMLIEFGDAFDDSAADFQGWCRE